MGYERLTKKGGLDFADKDLSLADEWGYSHIYNRLAKLEDKIEQGTLIELPRIVKTKKLDAKYCVEFINGFYGGIVDGYTHNTREEAEKRLKELQE